MMKPVSGNTKYNPEGELKKEKGGAKKRKSRNPRTRLS